jgi:hypothetical protein
MRGIWLLPDSFGVGEISGCRRMPRGLQAAMGVCVVTGSSDLAICIALLNKDHCGFWTRTRQPRSPRAPMHFANPRLRSGSSQARPWRIRADVSLLGESSLSSTFRGRDCRE